MGVVSEEFLNDVIVLRACLLRLGIDPGEMEPPKSSMLLKPVWLMGMRFDPTRPRRRPVDIFVDQEIGGW